MKAMRKMNERKGALAALVGGGLMAAALLWGCLNSVSVPGTGQEMTEQAAGGRDAPDSFTVMVLAKGTPGDSDSRSMTGQNAGNVMAADSLRNIIQLVVADSAGKVVSFSESRRDGESGSTVSFNVNLPAGEVYHFLILQGHWPYQGGKEDYGYLAGPPTLLSAGFASSMIASGSNQIPIKQQILATDIAFVPAAGFKQVEPRTGRESLLVPGRWSLNWTVRKGRVENGVAMDGAAGNGFEALLEARKALNPFAADPGFTSVQRSLNGVAVKSYDLSVTGNLVSLDLNLAMSAEGFVNFNLEYAPFGLSGSGAGWGEYDEQSVFDLSGGGPVWIIRNGLNDKAQDEYTDFSKAGVPADVGFYNGNGALRYRVLDPAADEDGDGIGNEQEIKWGTDPEFPDNGDGDSDGDGFSDKMEADNGFNPYDKEDNPGKAYPGSLAVSGAKELGTRKGPAATISFIAEGYAGIAKGYYQVAAKGAPAPAYSDYAAFPLVETTAGNNSGAQTLMVGLPTEEDAWKAAYDVYVFILYDRKASLPARVSLPEMTTNTIGVGGW